MKVYVKCVRLLLILAIVLFYRTSFAYTVNGQALCATTNWAPQGAVIQVFEVDPLPGGSYTVSSSALSSAVVNNSGGFTLNFTWPTAGPGFEAGGPDLIFRVTQNIGGAPQIIYGEAPVKTHWNLANGAMVNLKINSSDAACTNPAVTPGSVPNNNLFLFTRIGTYETANIDCKGSLASSNGYGKPRKAPFGFTGADTDMPFGGTLDMFGWIGKLSNIAYYKVKYSNDSGATWKDMDTSLPNKWYDTSDSNPLNWQWKNQSMGPFTAGGQSNLYQVPYLVRPDTPWAWLDRIVQFALQVECNPHHPGCRHQYGHDGGSELRRNRVAG